MLFRSRSDPSLKVEFGYIPIPANAADLPKYEGKYGNYLSSDADVLWSPVYDQNSPLTNWDSTNYISDGVDLYDGVEASTMVKIRVGYWLDLDDGTGTNTTVPTRVSYVDYSVNAQRMNDDARKLGLDLGLTKDEPTDEAWRRYAIDRLENPQVDASDPAFIKYTYYYPIITKDTKGNKNPYYDHDAVKNGSKNVAWLDMEQLGDGKLTDLWYEVYDVQYNGAEVPRTFTINGMPVGTRMPPDIKQGFDIKPEDFLNEENKNNTNPYIAELDRPFEIELTEVEDISVGPTRNIYTLVRVTAVSEAGMTSQYDIKIYEEIGRAHV